MMLSTIQVLEKAADLGLRLAIAPQDRLTFEPAHKCPKDFVETLKAYKPRLLGLLQVPFVMVDSAILGETIFFCADDDTRTTLIEAGADEFSIYTRDELRVLVEHNRVAPLTAAELRKVHGIKRTFHGKIAK